MCVYLKGALMERDGREGRRTSGVTPLPVPMVRSSTPGWEPRDWLNEPPVAGTVVTPDIPKSLPDHREGSVRADADLVSFLYHFGAVVAAVAATVLGVAIWAVLR